MSGTMMNSKPLSPSSAEPGSASTPDDAMAATSQVPPASSQAKGVRRGFPWRKIFVGPDGIYATPRWLIYLAMAWVIYQMESWLVVSVASHLNALWWRFASEAALTLAAILPGLVMAKIEGCRFGDFGLPARAAFGRNFWVGTLWGMASLTVMMLGLRAAGAFTFGPLNVHGARIVKFALYYAVLFLLVGFYEEFLLRGYSQWVLAKGMNFWPVAALLSISFGAMHSANPGESKTGLVAAGLMGFFFCLTLRRTGDLWWAVGFHMAWDWGESYLYSVPDSGTLAPGHLLRSRFHGPVWVTGGSVGPEGSCLVFAVIVALWVVFDRVYPQAKFGVSARS